MTNPAGDYNEQIEEFKLDNHIDYDNLNSKILNMAVPLVICNLLAYISQMFSLNIQQIYYSIDSVTANIAFLPMIYIVCEKLPLGFAYVMSFDLVQNRILQRTERCKMVLESYIYFSVLLGLLVGIVCVSIASVVAKGIFIPESYRASFQVYIALGYILNSLNAAMFYRYLAEQRIFLILVRAAVQFLGYMCIEQLLYTLVTERSGNMLTTAAFLVINIMQTVWQFAIATGYTAYGFKLRNVSVIEIAKLVKFSKETLKWQAFLLIKGLLKFVADMTAPFCLILAYTFVEQTFTDEKLKFFAHNDLFCYAYVYSLPKVVPDAFISVFALIDALMINAGSYRLQQKANILIIVLSIVVSAVIAALVYLLRQLLSEMYFDMANTTITSYFNDGQSNYIMAVLTSIILNCCDIFQQAGILCAVQANNYLEMVCLPAAKFIVSILSVITIRNEIGNRANYLYAIIFSEGCGDVIGVVYLFIDYLHFLLVTKKLDTTVVQKKNSKK